MVLEKGIAPILVIALFASLILISSLLFVMATNFKTLAITRNVLMDQSQNNTDQSHELSAVSGHHKLAQSFTPTMKTLTNVSINLYRETSDVDNDIQVAIFDNSSSLDGTNPPNSSQNITDWVTLSASSVGQNSPGLWKTFTFTQPIGLTVGRTYWLVVRLANGVCTGNVRYQVSESSDQSGAAYSSGVQRYSTGDCDNFLDSTSTERDFTFRTYVYQPLVTIESPGNRTYINYTWFNISLLTDADWCGFSLDDAANVTMENDTTTHFYYNQTEMNVGQHSILFWCNFSGNLGNQSSEATRYFTIDETTPEYENASTGQVSPTVYSTSKNHGFQIFARDNFMGFGQVILSLYNDSWQNYTASNATANTSASWVAYQVNITGLEVDNYTFKWYVSDSLHLNTTGNYTEYNVTQSNPSASLLLNGTAGQTYERGTMVNITSYASDAVLSTTIFANFTGTWINLTGNVSGQNTYIYNTNDTVVGWYVVGANTTGNKNYFSNSTHFNITFYINDTYGPNMTFNPVLEQSYGERFAWVNITANENISACWVSYSGDTNQSMANTSMTEWFYNQSSTLEGNHTVVVYCNDSYDNFGYNQSWFISDFTAPNVSNVSAAPGSPTTYSPTSLRTFNATIQDMGIVDTVILAILGNNYTMSYVGDNISFSPTGKIYTTNISGIAVGNYTFYFYINDSLGNSNTSDIFSYNITEAVPYTQLLLNGSSSNATVDYGQTVNITSSPSDSALTTKIYANFTGTLDSLTGLVQGQNTYMKNTGELPIGSYQVSANTTGNANYTNNATLMTWYIIVQDTQKPTYTAVSATPASILDYETIYYFMSNWTDNYGINAVLFSENSSGSYQNHTVTNISEAKYTYSMNPTDLQGVTTLGWRFYCTDNSTAQNLNQTDVQQREIKSKTTSLLTINPISVSISNMTVDGYNFTVHVVVTNNGGNTMYLSNISIAPRQYWYANATYDSCGNVTSGSSCARTFVVHVPANGGVGTLTLRTYANWTNPDHTSNSTTNQTSVIIASNKILGINENSFVNTTEHDLTTLIGTFTLNSTGNAVVTSVFVNTTGGNLSNSWITYTNSTNFDSTDNVTYISIASGSTETVYVNITVPAGQSPGNYWTNITAFSDGGTFRDWMYLNLTVPENYSWSADRTAFTNQTIEYGASGTLGYVNINNTGNMERNYSIGFDGSGNTIFYTNASNGIVISAVSSGTLMVSYASSGLNPGNYETTLHLTNTSSTPSDKSVAIPFTIENLPPTMSNIGATPTNVETGSSTVLSVDVSDAVGVSTVWVTINLPNSSVENYSMTKLPNPSTTYRKTFISYNSGTYSYRVYANDTDNVENSTSLQYFYATPNTTITLTPTPSSLTLDNITTLSANTTVLNITLNNTGNVTAYYLNVSLSTSGNVSSNSTLTNFNNLSSSTKNSSTYLVTVSAGTPPGTYTLPITATWTNPDASQQTSTNSYQIVVQQNKVINITHSLDLNMTQEASELHNFTVYSFGNYPASAINFSCLNCSDITTTFSPSAFQVAQNTTQEVEMNITIPSGKTPGEYTLAIYANGSSVSAQTNVGLTVQENSSWSISPTNMSLISGKDNSGIMDYVTVTNYGNVPLNFITSLSGDTSYIGINTTYIYLAEQTSALVAVNYTSSAVGNYTANLTISNSSGTPNSANTTINLSVLDMNITITGVSPSTNITAGNTIQMLANAFLEGSPLSSNIVWSAALNGTACPVAAQTNIINEVWSVNCTAPAMSDGLNYTLTLTANYTPASATVFDEYTINYADVSAPYLAGYEYPEVAGNQTLNISLNVTDNVLVDNATALIEFPNGTSQLTNITNSSQTFVYNFSGTQDLGEYRIMITANDSSNNTNSSIYVYFAVYTPVTFNGTVKDAANTGVLANFTFIRPRSNTIAANVSADSNGGYNSTINSTGNMTLNVSVYNSTLQFNDVMFFENKESAFSFDDVPTTEISGRTLKTLFINTSMNYSNVTLMFDYTGTGFTNEDYIGMYKCSSWNFSTRVCGSTWTKLSTTKNKITNTIQVTSTSLSAYSVAEYICGDGTCESSYGESCSVCTTDCGACSTSTTTSSGSGGGGGGGGGGGNTAVETTDKVLEHELSSSSVRLKRGETEVIFLNLLNKLGSPVSVSIGVSNLSKFVKPDLEEIEIVNGSKGVVVLKVSVPETTTPGFYLGDVLITYNNKTDKIPLSITVLSQGKKISMVVNVLSKEVSKEDMIKYRIVISNVGEEEDYQVRLVHTLRETATDRLLYTEEENITIEERLTLIKNISFDELDIQLSELSVEVKAYYDLEVEESVDTLTVVPWLLKRLMSLEFWRVGVGIAIIIFGSVPVYYTYSIRRRVTEKRKRYKIELDFDKIPSKGPNIAFIGKLAETERKTGLDLDNLTTHVMVAGATGSGKTVAAQAITEEALLKNKNVIVFDPSGQWTGFLRKCNEPDMIGGYKNFGLRQEDSRAFNGSIKIVKDPLEFIDIKSLVTSTEPKITVFALNLLRPEEIDIFVANTVMSVFQARLPESKSLKTLMVYDEVHRLLPKFGGSGKGFIQVERGAREFRKWGIGLVLVSQVLSDFVGEIRANIGIEIQMRTRYEDDLNRLSKKYGENVSRSIVKANVGTGLLEFSEYNDGKPYFVSFRPLLHQPTRLSDKELEEYSKHRDRVEICRFQMEELKGQKIDVFDIEIELKLAEQKLSQGAFEMTDMYIEGIENRLKAEWKRLGKTPPERVSQKFVDEEALNKSLQDAEKARKEYLQKEVNEQPKETTLEKIDNLYSELKTIVNDCKKNGAETFVEEIELDRVPSTLSLLKMRQDDKEAAAFLEKMESLKKTLNGKLEKAKSGEDLF